MNFKEAIILLTGADTAIGSALIEEFVNKNTRKIYAAGSNTAKLKKLQSDFGTSVYPLVLDMTDGDSIKAAATICNDVTALINCAGVDMRISFLGVKESPKDVLEMKVKYVALIDVICEFAEILEKNKPSVIVNILSVASVEAERHSSKAAPHAFTEAIRDDFSEKGIVVSGVYYGDVRVGRDYKTNANELCIALEKDDQHIFLDDIAKEYFEMNPFPVEVFS
jgi:NADP-dependent 3-hydroxy acid dehydrogenase YdfG